MATLADFETLQHARLANISGLGWSAPLISANFGGGFGAGIISNQDYGLHRWQITSEFLPDKLDFTVDYTVDEVDETDPYFTYYFEFFKRHILRGNKPFIIQDHRENKYYLVSFDNPDIDFSRVTAKFYTSEGLTVTERRHADLEFNADGSLAGLDFDAPTVPSTLAETSHTHNSITVNFGASSDASSIIYQYRLNGGSWTTFGSVTGTTTITGTITGLSSETEYDIEVRALDGAGNPSDPSNLITVTTDEYSTLLLNVVPGAVAAYALRKLLSSYSGACIRVKRSSDNTEQDIGFSAGVLDTASLATFCSGGGNVGRVVKWYDQSGNGNDAVFGTNGAVIYESGATIAVNSKPALDFRSGDFVYAELPTGILNAATALTYLHVIKVPNAAGSNIGIFGPSSTGGTGLEVLQTKVIGIDTYLRINNTGRTSGSNLLFGDDVQSLTEIYGNATNVTAYYNNSSVSLSSSAALPTLNFNGVYAIGRYASGQYCIGKFQFVVIYAASKSGDRATITSEINGFYSIY